MSEGAQPQMTNYPDRKPFVGILGGMGPLAGVDFANKLIAAAAQAWPIAGDNDQIPFVLWSVPQVPDRVAAALGVSDATSPLPAMITGLRRLESAGVDIIAIACNSAHAWYAEMQAAVSVPLLHIADATAKALSASDVAPPSCVGIIGTQATLQLRLYHDRLERAGITVIEPTSHETSANVMPAILTIKRSDPAQARPVLEGVCASLSARGAEAIVLACTDLPVALDAPRSACGTPLIDPARALAQACVSWSSLGGASA